MKKITLAFVLAFGLFASLAASGRTAVYAVIEKVVFEPNEANAGRIKHLSLNN